MATKELKKNPKGEKCDFFLGTLLDYLFNVLPQGLFNFHFLILNLSFILIEKLPLTVRVLQKTRRYVPPVHQYIQVN